MPNQQTDKELWERMSVYALNDDEFIKKMISYASNDEEFLKKLEDRRVEVLSWKIFKFLFGIILASIMLYAPAKLIELITSFMQNTKGK